MKNKISTYIFSACIALSVFVLTSCKKDFLDRDKLAEETSETYFVNQEKAIASLTAAYSDLKDYRFGWSGWAFGETMSDNTIYSGNGTDKSGFEPFKNFGATSDLSLARYKWQIPYRGIGKASQAIDGITLMNDALFDSQDLKKRIIAEARFLRAYYHFELVRAFGYIPIVDRWIRTPDERITQSEPQDVFNFIISELELAEPYLPLKGEYSISDLGRITKGTAQALLSKVNLYAENWQEARDWAEKVMLSGEYQLEADYANIFSLTNEHGLESIFEISFYDSPTESSAVRNNGNFQTLFQLPRNITYGYGINQPTQNLYDAFIAENDMIRMEATMLSTDEVFEIEVPDLYQAWQDALPSGDTSIINPARLAMETILVENNTGFYNQKIYLGPTERSGEIRNNPNNFIVIRYAEIYLIRAEAHYQLGEEENARTYMNDLREMRGLPRKETVSGTDLLNAIYTERRLELALENDRYPDLVRTQRATILPGFTDGKKYWPIPQEEIDNSLGAITQRGDY